MSETSQPIPETSALLYYSNLLLVILAALLTLIGGQILLGQFRLEPALLVLFATYLTYSFDNIVDWPRDRTRFQRDEARILRYQKASRYLMVLSGLGALFLLVWQKISFLVVFFVLAVFVVLFITHRVGSRINEPSRVESLFSTLSNRFFVATAWCLVSVFFSLWYTGAPLSRQALHLFVYLWPLLFTFAMFWKLEKASPQTSAALFTLSLGNGLAGLCAFSALLSFADVFLLRLFAPSYLVLAIPAVLTGALAVACWRSRQVSRLWLQSLFVIFIVFCFFLLFFFSLLPAHL